MEKERNNYGFSINSGKGWLLYHLSLIAICLGWGLARGMELFNAFINALPFMVIGSIPTVIFVSRELFYWVSSLNFPKRAESKDLPGGHTPKSAEPQNLSGRQTPQSEEVSRQTTGKSRFKWILPIAAVLLVGSFAFASVWLIFYNSDKQQSNIPTDTEIQNAINDINKKTSYITITESHISFEGTSNPKKQFEISISEKYAGFVYLFKVYEYTMNKGGEETEIPTSALCEMIDAAYNEVDKKDKKLLEALTPKIDVKFSLPIKPISAEISIEDINKVIVEILFAIRQLSRLNSSQTQILIKGAADGYKIPYDRPLDGFYKYSSVEVYPPNNWTEQSEPCSYNDPNPAPIYKNQPVTLSLPLKDGVPKYRNCDLPDLRAKFTKEVFVDPFLTGCKESRKIETRIIKGHEFIKEKDVPLKRKSQVFVLLYWD